MVITALQTFHGRGVGLGGSGTGGGDCLPSALVGTGGGDGNTKAGDGAGLGAVEFSGWRSPRNKRKTDPKKVEDGVDAESLGVGGGNESATLTTSSAATAAAGVGGAGVSRRGVSWLSRSSGGGADGQTGTRRRFLLV